MSVSARREEVPAASPRTLPPSVAAVDLGSNSFHMIVAKTDGGELVVVDRLREMVRLASGLDEHDNLTEEARERALGCLRKFGQRVAHLPPGSVRAVGTNTLRRANDAAEFLEQAEDALGHAIETISGIEEARLVWLGALHALQDRGHRRLVIDIGGGSTEVIVGESTEPLALDSLFVGCVSMSRTFFPDGKIDKASWRRAALHAQQEFEPVSARYVDLGWQEAIGTSGTIRAVSSVVRAAGWSDRGITPGALAKLRDALLAAGHESKLRLDGLSAQRRPVFAGGVVVLSVAFEALGLDAMQPSDGALREGLLHDLLGRFRHEDVRDRSVTALAARQHVDAAQADRVERTARELLEQVEGTWKLGDGEADRFLAWAARLHEVGLEISHTQYHKHGEYIVAHTDLAGFSRDEQRVLATLVRAHRRKFPVPVLREVPSRWYRSGERLSVLLRLATVIHRSRSPAAIPSPRFEVRKRDLRLEFPEGWLDTHPLTRADLEQERGYLAAGGYRLSFE